MQEICDDTIECEFQVPGGLVLTCVDPYDIHYMNVNYSCLPGENCFYEYFLFVFELTVFL